MVLAGRNAGRGEQVVAELQATGADAVFVRTDVSDVDSGAGRRRGDRSSGTAGSTAWSTRPA